jgi:hypothetical protein
MRMDLTTTPRKLPLVAFASADGSPTLGEAALAYARADVPVFPCVPGSKPPMTGAGYKSATADIGQVAAWWRSRPNANIGIPTGVVSGLDVVDIDLHGDASGRPMFERARDAHLVDGWAWSVQTPSGGLHVYYPHAHGVSQRCWTTSAHIDFRGDGGYVVAPPSRIAFDQEHSAVYTMRAISNDPSRAIDAAALRRFIDPPRSPRPTRFTPRQGRGLEDLVGWVERRGPGTRNSGLFWAACEMARHGYSHDNAIETLGPAAIRAGLGQREVEVTVDSAFRRQPPIQSLPRPTCTSTREGMSR